MFRVAKEDRPLKILVLLLHQKATRFPHIQNARFLLLPTKREREREREVKRRRRRRRKKRSAVFSIHLFCSSLEERARARFGKKKKKKKQNAAHHQLRVNVFFIVIE